jgi:hypothetical protein
MYTLDLLRYKIIGIELRSGHFIDYLKFTLEDINSDIIELSPGLGGSGGSFHMISYESIIGFQEVTRIFGTTTNHRSIRSIAFEYKTLI